MNLAIDSIVYGGLKMELLPIVRDRLNEVFNNRVIVLGHANSMRIFTLGLHKE